MKSKLNQEGLTPVELSEKLTSGDLGAKSDNFNAITVNNQVEILIDGHETFKRYYEVAFLDNFTYLYSFRS